MQPNNHFFGHQVAISVYFNKIQMGLFRPVLVN